MSTVRIALIDDHRMIRQGMRSMLDGAMNIEVVGEAANADEALELISTERPNLAFLDLQIPSANGLELLLTILQKHAETKVVVLSAYLNPVLLRTSVSAGVSGYLLKDTETFSPENAFLMLRLSE